MGRVCYQMLSDHRRGCFDMRDFGAVLDHDESLPIRHAIKCSSVAGSLAQRHQASAQ
jgi:hypothetical protein